MIQVKYKYIFLCDFQFFLISTFALNNRKFEDLKIKRERKYMSGRSEEKDRLVLSECAREDVLTISQSFPFAVSSHGTRKNIFRANWNGDRARRRDEGIAASLAKSCREFFCLKRAFGTAAAVSLFHQFLSLPLFFFYFTINNFIFLI